MKTVNWGFLLLLGVLLLPSPGKSSTAAEYQTIVKRVELQGDNGIFKNKKKKKKDCDCPGNKKNRRKVARERRKNHTA